MRFLTTVYRKFTAEAESKEVWKSINIWLS